MRCSWQAARMRVRPTCLLSVNLRSRSGSLRPAATAGAQPEDYDRTLCLLPRDVVDFVLATQPKEWTKLKQHHGTVVRE